VVRFASVFALAALLAACGEVITPTASSNPVSPTDAATMTPSETAFKIQTVEPTSAPGRAPINTHTGETRPPEEPISTPGPADTGVNMFQSQAFRFTGGTQRIPPRYTCDGIDVSPPLEWTVPGVEAVSEFAIVVTDPDAGGFAHWVVARIPGTDTGLDEGAGDPKAGNGLLQGQNSFGSTGYRGPCPPAGATHRYRFALYGFITVPDLRDTPTAEDVTQAGGAPIVEFDALYGH
jgi:Raf kinase inhibitor-like YbhB/YbcL family protein